MKIQTGHVVTCDVKTLGTKTVSFADADGRVMFEVKIIDGKTISVRGAQDTNHGGVIHGTTLLVKPQYANEVHITTEQWESK